MHDQSGLTPRPAPRQVATPAHETAPARPAARATAEGLEGRTLMAVQAPVTLSVGPNVNITRMLENQNVATIAIDRTDPGRLFVASTNDARNTGLLDDQDLDTDGTSDTPPLIREDEERGLIGARSEDGGATWVVEALDQNIDTIADFGLTPPCCDPSVAFDDFGNLFATFIDREFGSVYITLSTDQGRTFRTLQTYSGFDLDQPTVATGNGAVWVTFLRSNQIVATGARVLGPGVVQTFSVPQVAPRSDGGNFGDVAIGPNGEVIVSYQITRLDPDVPRPSPSNFFNIGPDGRTINPEDAGPAEIFVNVDPDGFGPELFGKRFELTDTNVGVVDPIPGQMDNPIDAEVGLAWDRSGGPFNGRIWAVYTDENRDEGESDLNIYVRFSDDMGQTWSQRRVATDEDFARGAQFLPRIAIDQTTGNIALAWYDSREQSAGSFADNIEAQLWGTVGVPTVGEAGVAFADDVRISSGFSDAQRSRSPLDFGDYIGLDFHNNVFYPVWADNSNSTGDNPSGGVMADSTALATLDLYTARVLVTPTTPDAPNLAPVGPGSPLRPDFVGKQTVTKGKVFRFQVRYESDNGINLATLGDDDILVTGPKGYNLFADFTKAKRSRGGTVVTGTYQAFAPGGKWDQGDNGLYSILLQAGAVSDLAGTSTAGGTLDQFLVSSTLAPQSPLSPALMPAPRALESSATALDVAEDDKLSAMGL